MDTRAVFPSCVTRCNNDDDNDDDIFDIFEMPFQVLSSQVLFYSSSNFLIYGLIVASKRQVLHKTLLKEKETIEKVSILKFYQRSSNRDVNF